MRPIYVRNQAEKSEDLAPFHARSSDRPDAAATAQFNEWTSFCKLDGRYTIPGTSIKGVIRNVIKIAAFGSFREAASEDRYSMRDLNLPAYQKKFVSGRPPAQIRFLSEGGWLRHEGDKWIIYPSSYQRVEQSDLARLSGRITWDNFLNTAAKDKSNDPKESAVEAKNTLWLGCFPNLEMDYTAGAIMDQTLNRRHLTSAKDGGPLRLTYG